MAIDVLTQSNEKAGSVELDPAVFEAAVKPHLFHAEVRRQLAVRRGGNHSTKNRSAASGGGAKPWRQKGTGRARQGSSRAAQFAGGGVVFGPVPRSYAHKLPKKMRAAALRGALSEKATSEAIVVIEALQLEGYKTAQMVEILGALGLGDQSVLIVLDAANPTVEGSARNLPKVCVVRAEGLNVYDVLRHSKLLVTRAAVDQVVARLASADAASGDA
jgi:large subunit ribosomal protein L4